MQKRILKAFLWYGININKILFYTCCTTLAILLAERIMIIFSYEAHTAGIDNNFDYPIIRSLAGFSIYPDPSAYPYAVNPYAPLFFFICKWLAVILHLSSTDTISIYRVSRSVALLADAGSCVLLFRLLRIHLKVTLNVTITGLTFFFGILCYLGYTINRSDALFLFFYCATIFFLFRSSNHNYAWRPVITALLVTLCIFSKQNGISLLLLAPVWLLLEKKYITALWITCLTMLLCSGLFVYFEYCYTDHFFSKHIIDSLRNRIDPKWFYIYVFKLIAGSYLTLPLAVSLIISLKSIAENKNQLLKRIGVLFIMQLLFCTALCLKWGSSVGYYNESFLLALINIALFFTNTAFAGITSFAGRITSYIYPALITFIIHITSQLYFFFINSKAEARIKFNDQLQVSDYIKRKIGTQNKYVMDLSDPDFNFFKNLLYKESAAPNMDAVRCCTLPDKVFDYSGLLHGLQNGKISLLIEEKDAAKKSLWGIDLRNYQQDTSFLSYTIYKYNPTSISR